MEGLKKEFGKNNNLENVVHVIRAHMKENKASLSLSKRRHSQNKNCMS